MDFITQLANCNYDYHYEDYKQQNLVRRFCIPQALNVQ